VAVIGASFCPNQTDYEPLYRLIETPEDLAVLCQTVREASTDADIVILLCHWGDEFAMVPSKNQLKTAKELVNSGANLIMGHHPHVYQGLQRIDSFPVFFSLGNFVSDMRQSYLRRAAIGVVEIRPDLGLEAWARPIRIDAEHRPVLSESKSDYSFLCAIDQRSAMNFTRSYDTTYSSTLKRASARFKRDCFLDFILNLGRFPSAKLEIGKDSLRNAITSVLKALS